MPRIKTAPSAVPTARKPIHYHLLLRPVLQRRFARASLWTFVVCCIVSFLIGDRYVLRLLLPWSATYLRGILIFATVFPVLVIRKADLHVDFKPYTSPFSLVGKEILSVSTIHSVLTYITSALCVSCIYLRNASEHANLSTTITRGYELPRLNERLVYLLYFSSFASTAFGLFQRAVHRTLLPYKSVTAHLRTELVHAVAERAMVSGLFALSSALSAPVFYLFVRPTIWTYALRFARTFIKMPRSSTLPDFPASLGLFFRSVWLAFVMTSLWEATNLFFDAFITKTPASQGEILSMKSDDPNGTLITGLQNRDRPFTQAWAFEELCYIAYNSKDRRRTIYSEHGNGPSTWNHVLRALLEILSDIKKNHQGPQYMTSSSQTSIPSETSETTPQLPLMQGNIFVSNGAQKLPFGFVRSMDGPEENLTLSTNLDASRWRSQLESFLGAQNRHISWPFYPCIEQQAAASLPHLRCTVCAIQGTSQLVVRSALEDSLGLVQWDIGVLLNCLCITLTTLEKYILSRPRQTHTPLLFLQRNVVTLEQDVVIRAIKLAVSDIVHEFGHHLDQVGLNTSAAELCQRAWDRELI